MLLFVSLKKIYSRYQIVEQVKQIHNFQQQIQHDGSVISL